VDPAENLAATSRAKGHDIHVGYFDESFVKTAGMYAIVIAQNVFAHNYDPLTFLNNAKNVMAHDSLLFIQTSQADMIRNNEFDTIYHEHISFYNINSMNELCKRAGLNLIEVLKHPIHGNSFIFVISKSKARSSYIELLLNNESSYNLYDENTYEAYVSECKEIIEAFAVEVRNHKAAGKTVIGYGAPAKGNTLLNASNIILDFIIDDNPMKQGLFTPGMRVPIFSSEKLKEYENENVVFVPLAWNFFEEIQAKIKKMRPDKKDAFLRYFPYVFTE